MGRAKPRAPEPRPFAGFARPKWWHEAKSRAVDRICRERSRGGGLVNVLAVVIGMNLDGVGLTDDECMVFGIERDGYRRAMMRMLASESPLFKVIPKTDFRGDLLSIPIKITGGEP